MSATRLVEGSAGPAFAIADDGTVLAVNTAGEQLFDRPARTLVGRYCGDVVAALDATGASVCRTDGCPTLEALEAGRATSLGWCAWVRPDGAPMPISAHAIAVPRDARAGDRAAAIVLIHTEDTDTTSGLAGTSLGAVATTRLHLLGATRVQQLGDDVTIRRRRSYELLAMLALAGEAGVGRDRLCDRLWPESPVGDGRAHLRVLVHGIRQALGAEVVVGPAPGAPCRDTLHLASHVWTDVGAFEREANAFLDASAGSPADRTRRLQRATAIADLYHGDLGEGAAFGTWALPHRERLRSLLVRVLADAAVLAASTGNVPQAITFCQRAVTADPLHEGFRVALITAYGRLGRRTEALAQYRAYRRLLASELSLKPSPAVERALRQAV